MTETHDPDSHHGPQVRAYLVVFGALAVFTAVSFVANWMTHPDEEHPEKHYITVAQSFVIILAVAVVKAVLVGTYFMHLKWDWRKLFFLILPAFVLAAMMITVLLPDMVLAWQHREPVFSRTVERPAPAH